MYTEQSVNVDITEAHVHEGKDDLLSLQGPSSHRSPLLLKEALSQICPALRFLNIIFGFNIGFLKAPSTGGHGPSTKQRSSHPLLCSMKSLPSNTGPGEGDEAVPTKGPPAERRHSPDAPAAPLAPEAGPPLPLSVPPLPPSVSRAQKHGKRVPPPPCENVSRAAPAGPGVSAGAVTRLDCVETRVPGRQRTRTLRAGVSRRGSHARRNPRDGRTEPCPPRVPSPLGPKPRGVPGSPVFTLELQIRPTVVRWYIGTSFRRAVVKKS